MLPAPSLMQMAVRSRLFRHAIGRGGFAKTTMLGVTHVCTPVSLIGFSEGFARHRHRNVRRFQRNESDTKYFR